MELAELEQAVTMQGERIARLESQSGYLATREQVSAIQSELQNVKMILMGSLGAILFQILVSWVK